MGPAMMNDQLAQHLQAGLAGPLDPRAAEPGFFEAGVAGPRADAWAAEWGVGSDDIPEFQFPPIPTSSFAPPPSVQDLLAAVRSFPEGTAIGSDAFHPRVLLRVSEAALALILKLLCLCELTGTWPLAVNNILIALLPKPSGGLRPIGIFPSIIRIWMRLRAPAIRLWERAHERPFFFASKKTRRNVCLLTKRTRGLVEREHVFSFSKRKCTRV